MAKERWRDRILADDQWLCGQLGITLAQLDKLHEMPGHEIYIKDALDAGITFEVAAAQYLQGQELVGDSNARWFEIFHFLRETPFATERDIFNE